MKRIRHQVSGFVRIFLGCAVFSLGFNLFLEPLGLNAGGLSGIAMVLVKTLKFGSVGLFTAAMNLPLFALGAARLGKRFLAGSLLGMALSAVMIDGFAPLPAPEISPILGAIYGGVLCGAGLGLVFSAGVTTGGSDIIVRLINSRFAELPLGVIGIIIDGFVVALTGIAFRDAQRMLYSGIAVFLTGKMVDAVLYRLDFSRVALIVSREHETIVAQIVGELSRGATLLQGYGAYSQQPVQVILTAVKRNQVARLRQIVAGIDPQAFVILQEAHRVLGDGFEEITRKKGRRV